MRWALLVLFSCPGLCLAVPGLDTAREHLDGLRFSEAASALAAVAQLDNLTREEAVEFYLLDGLVRASLNDTAGARRAFTQALAIDPLAKLPGKLSPRVSTAFAEGQRWVKEHGSVGAELEARERTGAASWKLSFKPLRDDGGLVREVRFLLIEDGVRRELRVLPSELRTLEPRGRQATISWVLLGTHSWELSEGGPLTLDADEGQAAPKPAEHAQTPVAALLPPGGVRRFSLVPGIVCLSVGGLALGIGGVLLFVSDLVFSLPVLISGVVAAGVGIGLVVASNRSMTAQVSLSFGPRSGMASLRGVF